MDCYVGEAYSMAGEGNIQNLIQFLVLEPFVYSQPIVTWYGRSKL